MFNLYVVFRNEPGSLAAFGTLLGQHGIGLEGGGVFQRARKVTLIFWWRMARAPGRC